MKKHKFLADKMHYILFGILLLIGIIVRFWGLGDKSLWVDEFYSYLFCSQKTFFSSFVLMFADLSPPIYYLVLYFTIKLFGNTEFIMRLPSFFAGIASIVAVYFLTKKTFNKEIALGTTILTTFSPVLLYYSQEARPYSLFVLFSIFTVAIWIELINKINSDEDLNSKILLKYAVFSLLTILTHYWGLIMVFFQVLYLLLAAFLRKQTLKNLIITAGNIFYISVFYLIIQYSFYKKYSLVLNPAYARVNTLNPLVQLFNYVFYENYVFFLIIIVFFLFNLKNIKTFVNKEVTEKKLASPLIYLTYIIILPVCFYLILDKTSSLLHPRHLLFILPIAYLLISYIIFSFDENKKVLKSFFVFALALTFLGIYLFFPQKIQNRSFTYYNKPKQEWMEATKYAAQKADKNSLIIIDRAEVFYDYYFKKLDKDMNKFNIVVDKQIFDKKDINQKLDNYRKKYKKVYIFSTSMLGVERIYASMEEAKSSCNHLEQKNYVNINFYECY